MRDLFFNINQAEALKLMGKYKNLSLEDLILLRKIADFTLSSKTLCVIIEDTPYFWVDYSSIQEDLPIIFQSVRGIKERMKKLKDIGLLTNKAYRAKKEDKFFTEAGTYSVITLSQECKKIFDTPKTENEEKKQEGTLVASAGVHSGEVQGCTDGQCTPCTDRQCNKEYLKINTLNNNIHTQEQSKNSSPIIQDILKKYSELNLPDYEYAPKDYIIMECLQTLGAENLFKALRLMSESDYVQQNMSINSIFKVENLKSALNGNFKNKVTVVKSATQKSKLKKETAVDKRLRELQEKEAL